jgi:methionyl-tRNA synthetase
MDNMQFHKAAEILQNAIMLVNRQIEIDTPWKLAKTDTDKLASCICAYLQATDIIMMHLLPFMPTMAEKIWQITGANCDITLVAKKYFKDTVIPENGFSIPDAKLQSPGILFPRIA